MHRPGLSPATPGESLIYAQCATSFARGEEIGSFPEELGPGEDHSLKTFRVVVNEGKFRLEEHSFERYHAGRWMSFDEWCHLPETARAKAPWLLSSGAPALRPCLQVKAITRDEALIMVRDKILFPAIGAAIPHCFSRDLWVNVTTTLPIARRGRRRGQQLHVVGTNPAKLPMGTTLARI